MTGRVEAAKAFDTYKTSKNFEEFIESIPHDYVIVIACKDECATKLSLRARKWFEEMGSVEVANLNYR